jgi:ABC-2 type transport system permease protein
MAGLIVLPAWLAMKGDKKERNIAVYDESGLFSDQFPQEGYTKYDFIQKEKYSQLKDNIKSGSYYAMLYIPGDVYTSNTAQLISDKQIPFELTEQIESKLSRVIENDKRGKVIAETQIPDLEKRLADTRTRVKLNSLKVTETGEAKKSNSFVAFGASYIMGFIIYFFVFMYGSLVMRSVMEEKKSRIVEVIVSSVKPFQLMAGKIVGTALVGLTQVAIWIVIGGVAVAVLQGVFSPEKAQQIGQSIMESQQQMPGSSQVVSQMAEKNQVMEVIEMIGNLNLPLILFSFVFYFLGGYLLYSSLMGAVGAAVDNEEDTQQLVFPVTFPLILSIIILFSIAKNPEGPIAFWASIVPFTSPVCMLARVPYDVPIWQLALSMGLLVLTTIGAIWAAAKIYKTGILMYGKKVTLKELIKWVRYKN